MEEKELDHVDFFFAMIDPNKNFEQKIELYNQWADSYEKVSI